MTNLRSKLKDFGLTDAARDRKTVWLKPGDTVATLSVTMDMFGYRHIPIMETKDGPLLAVVSIGDCVRIQTPPEQELPLDRLEACPDFRRSDLYNEVDKTGSKTIREAFPELFRGDTNTVVSIYEDDVLEDVFSSFLKKFGSRRYRTLPIRKKNLAGITGMLSYTDLLGLIQDPVQENQSFLSLKVGVDKVFNPDVKTLTEKHTLADAINMFRRTPFRHIPLTQIDEGAGNSLVGIVDDIIIKTFQHELLFEHLRDMPLGEIAALANEACLLSEDNTVTVEDDIKTVISRFIDKKEKPTAILVGEWHQKMFLMKGIISYVDVFNKFLEEKKKGASLSIPSQERQNNQHLV